MIPEPHLMVDLIIEAEKAAHSMGWDSTPPVLGGAFTGDNMVWSSPMPALLQPFNTSEDLAEGIDKITAMLRDYRLNGQSMHDRPPKAQCGFWIVAEAWALEQSDGVPRDKYADTPGAEEARFGILLDFAGLLHAVLRFRDSEDPPISSTFTPDDQMPEFCNGLMDPLRELTLENALWMEDGAVDVVEVSRWKDHPDE